MDRAGRLTGALEGALDALGLAVPGSVVDALGRYHALLEQWQGRVRLVGRTDPEVVAVRHLADSLTVLPFLAGMMPGARVLDVGTGAGLPGLPLALARPELAFHLVEADHRKAAFVKAAVAELGCTGVRVHAVRAAGHPGPEGLPEVDLAVSRAVSAPGPWLALGRPYLAPGGRVVAMMAAQAPDDPGLEAVGRTNGLSLGRVWRGALPGDAGPRVVAAWARPA